MFKRLALFSVLTFAAVAAHASYQDPEPEVSTAPIGSSYYRHLAQISNIDIRELVKFEKRGFGRTEINMLIEISSGSLKTLKDFGNRRLKDRVSMETLVKESNMDFDTVYKHARELKARIEAMGDQNLPPAVYETPLSTPAVITPKETKEEKKARKEREKKERIQKEKEAKEQPLESTGSLPQP